MSAYIPSASVLDHPEDGHCLQCLTSTLKVMTMITQPCTGRCLKKSCTLPRVEHTCTVTRTTLIASPQCQKYESYVRTDTSTLKKTGLIEFKNKPATTRACYNNNNHQHTCQPTCQPTCNQPPKTHHQNNPAFTKIQRCEATTTMRCSRGQTYKTMRQNKGCQTRMTLPSKTQNKNKRMQE